MRARVLEGGYCEKKNAKLVDSRSAHEKKQ